MTKTAIPLNERIIFALDVDTPEKAKEWVLRLESHIHFYKVGLQLFLAGGFAIVEWIQGRGHKVMVDLKFYDIGETVKLAVEQVARHGATFATVHGNDAVLRAANETKGATKILSVTVLTSFDQSDMEAMGMTHSVEELVRLRAKKSIELGCDGVVSSGLEAARLRQDLGQNFLIVTPGIRPALTPEELKKDDQKRIVTAEQAIINGASHMVVGRPIARSPDPIATVEQMQREIAEGLARG